MKRFLLAGATLLVLTAAQPTLAADAPVYKGPPPAAAALFNWSGLYIGINGGYGWGTGFFRFDPPTTGEPGNFDVKGGLIGGTIGWNWQAPGSNLVWGIEGDLDWTNIKGGGLCPNPTFSCNVGNSWIGTVRGRLGVAMNTLLLYATGGFAFGDIRGEGIDSTGVLITPGTVVTKTGWTAGAGVEAAVGANWSVKAEWLYVDLGSATCNGCGSFVTPATMSFKTNLFRVGANLRF